MSIRVTATEVKDIMDNCTVDDSIVTIYIGVASTIIDELFATDTTTPAVILKEIERFYSAHLIASALDRVTLEEKIGDAAVIYSARMGKGFEATPYGQALLQIDISGKMANIGKRSATITAVKQFDE